MKLKFIALAALAVSGVAHAAIDNNVTTNGTVAFAAYDNLGTSKSSVYLDLGFNVRDFFTGTAVTTLPGVTEPIGVLANNNTTVVWNFANNTITFNGTLKAVTNDFSAALTFLSTAQAADIRWGVLGSSNFTLNAAGDAITTPYTNLATGAPTATQLANQTAALSSNAVGVTGDQVYSTYANLLPGVADNESYFASNSGDQGYFAKTTIAGTNWNGNLAWAGFSAATKQNAYIIDGEGFNSAVGAQPEGPNANLLNNKGTFTFDAASKTLTWATPVPEAESYALALAGLGLLAAVARRRAAR
jgi:MYXO-CTERM domain-containing protein